MMGEWGGNVHYNDLENEPWRLGGVYSVITII